jgi:probable rRNA maturation factor
MGERSERVARNTSRHEIAIENCQRKIPLRLAQFDNFLRRSTKEIGVHHDAAFVRFVTDREMARLNGKYRKKPKTTDVLSFPSEQRKRPTGLCSQVRSIGGSFLGDIAIAPTVARRNAQEFGRTFEHEICILILHGLLHLLGYDHETDQGEMERVEAKLRRRLRLA